MKRKITLSAEETAIRKARRRAAQEHTTLNELFRRWLDNYVARGSTTDSYPTLIAHLSHVRAGRKFSREEMNERRQETEARPPR
ncbi:MAG: DUF6364 family protein [Chloroflexota bacterium]